MWIPSALLFLSLGTVEAQQVTSPAQQTSSAAQTSAMPPSEAYQYAMAPFNDARQQPNDLTDADRWALGISLDRAVKACAAIPHDNLPTAPTELIAMGRLCIFGQQHDRARQALIAYLALPSPPDRELARLLLVRAFLGLQSPVSAESQIESLLSEFPYDANIHYAIDQTVDAASGTDNEDVARRLNEQQLSFTLKSLQESGSVTTPDKSAVVTSAQLFLDALRVASQMRADGKQKEADNLTAELSLIAADPKYAQSAQLPAMNAALYRYGLVGSTLQLKIRTRTTAPQTPLVLIPIVLWAPSSADVVKKISEDLKHAHSTAAVYAITSVEANAGVKAEKPEGLMNDLHALQQSLPDVPLLVLPNSELENLSFDNYPGGVVVDSKGVVHYLDLLQTSGSIRLLEKTVTALTHPSP